MSKSVTQLNPKAKKQQKKTRPAFCRARYNLRSAFQRSGGAVLRVQKIRLQKGRHRDHRVAQHSFRGDFVLCSEQAGHDRKSRPPASACGADYTLRYGNKEQISFRVRQAGGRIHFQTAGLSRAH